MTEGTYRTKGGASSDLSGVYVGPLIRHCLRDRRGPMAQAFKVPYTRGYSGPPRDSPITSGHSYPFVGHRVSHFSVLYPAHPFGVVLSYRKIYYLRQTVKMFSVAGEGILQGVTATLWGDYYAPGCRLLSSSVQPYPQQAYSYGQGE